MNFLERTKASVKPSAISIFSQIGMKSGTTIAQYLNYAFKFSGKVALPA